MVGQGHKQVCICAFLSQQPYHNNHSPQPQQQSPRPSSWDLISLWLLRDTSLHRWMVEAPRLKTLNSCTPFTVCSHRHPFPLLTSLTHNTVHLGILETQDQIAAGRSFSNLGYVDGSRLGIWGWVTFFLKFIILGLILFENPHRVMVDT